MSLICASMTWLRDYKRKKFYEGLNVTVENEPEWIKKHVRETRVKEAEERLAEFEQRAKQIRKIEANENRHNVARVKRKKVAEDPSGSIDDASFLLDDYSSDSEKKFDATTGVSEEVQRLLSKLSDDALSTEPDDEPVKIFFASRTHSQLSQFVSQLRLTEFPSSVSQEKPQTTKHVPLGSRKQLCINPQVSNLSSVMAVNDACVDLQKSGGKGCEFLKSEKNPAHKPAVTHFTESVVSSIRDIEDLAELGRSQHICPYYASRASVGQAEIVTLPYQLLIQRESREALGLDLRNSVVVIDEAHNLLDTISSIYSSQVSTNEVKAAVEGLMVYFDKFKKRLNPGNRVHIAQILKSLTALQQFLEDAKSRPAKETAPGSIVNQNGIFDGTSVDLINFRKLRQYIDASKLAFKVDSYIEKLAEQPDTTGKAKLNASARTVPRNVLGKVVSFLVAITNPSSEGRLVFGRSERMEIQLEYILLDPSHPFKEVVEQARCVVLAGGTMQPVEDYTNYLFPSIEPSSVKLFSAGHVIPSANVSVLRVGSGPDGEKLLFTFNNRSNTKMASELGSTLLNVARNAPDGLVVFFPSYQMLSTLSAVWHKTGQWDKLDNAKKIFQEPKAASDVDSVLSQYSATIASSPNGAMLFSVVGGKMSEGINFSDGLARAVVMIGLPFPSLFSAEMIAKRQFVEQAVIARGGSTAEATEAAREYYENVCMRAVNQSIGRAIRHAGDYAAIVLIDERYSADRINSKLPAWLRASIHPQMLSGATVTQKLSEFFSTRG